MTTAQQKHTEWLAAEIQAAIDDPRPSIPHVEVMARMDAQLARLKDVRPVRRQNIWRRWQHKLAELHSRLRVFRRRACRAAG